MKKLFFITTFIFLLMGNMVYADCGCANQTKCLDLMTSMYNERAALYNVLNLSADQQKCKDVIDAQRYDELKAQFRKYEQEKFVLTRLNEHEVSKNSIKKQEKVVKDLEKCMQKTSEKYDKEFKSILNSEQKAKLKTIRKMEKSTIKYCQKNKAFYKKDPNLRPFGVKMYENESNALCPVHKKWHLFGFKHKTK